MSGVSFMDGSGDTFRNDSLATSLSRFQKVSPPENARFPLQRGFKPDFPPEQTGLTAVKGK